MASDTVAGPQKGRGALPRKAVVPAVAALLVAVAITVPFVFLESRALDISERRDVPMVPGAESVRLTVMANVGDLEVYFAPLDGKAAEVFAEIEGRAGYFGRDEPLDLVLEHVSEPGPDGRAIIRANISFNAYAPWPHYSLERTHFTVVVNESLRTSLDLKVVTGGIDVRTSGGVVLEGLRLNATSKGAAVTFNNGTVLAGNVSIHTATGGIQFRWYDVSVMNCPKVVLSESSGPINVTIRQHRPLNGSLEIKAVDVLGNIELRLDLSGINSGEVCSKRGKIANGLLEGFTGSLPPSLRTKNYDDPDVHRMSVQLNNTFGGIMLDGRWTA